MISIKDRYRGGGDRERHDEIVQARRPSGVLPEAFPLPGQEVMVSRDGDKVILEPMPAEKPSFDSKAFCAEIDALGGGEFLPDGLPDDPPLAPRPR